MGSRRSSSKGPRQTYQRFSKWIKMLQGYFQTKPNAMRKRVGVRIRPEPLVAEGSPDAACNSPRRRKHFCSSGLFSHCLTSLQCPWMMAAGLGCDLLWGPHWFDCVAVVPSIFRFVFLSVKATFCQGYMASTSSCRVRWEGEGWRLCAATPR